MNHKNLGLLLAVVVTGLLGYFAYTNNFSISKKINNIVHPEFSSPYGPKPDKGWEQRWDAERAK